MKSRVSPLAGGTNRREGVDSDSDLSTGKRSGLLLDAGVPRCGEGEIPRGLEVVTDCPLTGTGGGGVNLSIVNVK